MTSPADVPSATRTRAVLDQLGQMLLARNDSPSVLQRIVDLAAQAMPPGTEVSLTLVRDDQPTTAAFTGALAEELDEMQYQRGYGPCLEAALGGLFIDVADARTEDRWPEYVPTFLERGALSALAAPVPAAHLTGAVNVYARAAHAFSEDDRAALGQFAGYAGAVLTNMDALQDARDLAENLHKAMEFRSVIEQAKGILVERYKVTTDESFRLLADASMRANRKVREVAEELVLTGELVVAPPSHHRRTPRSPRDRRA
ncbi:GAF and ANTAR domain-containing protein [Modestobacter altitudinis]|uniref:GAF and ANTAR domain-containing protein n=1 Tax=Modestobacter altitudinis TaxID=2213158 RepID=UPI001FEB7460|nr:GAF and ANTAR domain-containing protein [Modestobacter altitudinis]